MYWDLFYPRFSHVTFLEYSFPSLHLATLYLPFSLSSVFTWENPFWLPPPPILIKSSHGTQVFSLKHLSQLVVIPLFVYSFNVRLPYWAISSMRTRTMTVLFTFAQYLSLSLSYGRHERINKRWIRHSPSLLRVCNLTELPYLALGVREEE